MNHMCGSLRVFMVTLAGLLQFYPTDIRAAEATPQRPSISFSAFTVPDASWEIESGGMLAEGVSSLPFLLKYGWTDRFELEIGGDAIRSAEEEDDTTTTAGDLVLGARGRVREGERAAFALAGWVKVPTAVQGAGSQEYDAGVLGIVSMPAGPLALDANLWLSAIGQGDRSALGQVQTVVTVGVPMSGCWSTFAEVAWQTTASVGSGGFVDAGLSCATTPGSVFDVAAGIGWSDGFPDWAVNIGWTFLAESRETASPDSP